jgi:hypothetical protein
MKNFSPKLKPRDYQSEAVDWALQHGRAIVCMPTGTGKTLIAGLWIKKLLDQGKARKILVLEPTRFMVEQTNKFFREKCGLPSRPVHGSLPRSIIRNGFKAKIVVATPEIVIAEGEDWISEYDAIVVDECHHTTGQDAYMKVMKQTTAKWRLGLTPFVPLKRKKELEKSIGAIRCWSWSDPRVAKYIPSWAGEVYEAEFNPAERRLYEAIESIWMRVEGRYRPIIGNALRWLARDGALSLRETFSKESGRLREILGEISGLLWDKRVRPLHKLDSFKRVLHDYEGEYSKAIVFVDRVIVAEAIARDPVVAELNPVLLLGRRRVNPRDAVVKARKPSSRLIIATSAGEEGIDLPEADLLILWSNTASPLRFVQRLGRVLRAGSRGRQKNVVFIATPDTVDMDSLLDGILLAEKHGVRLGLDPSVIERMLNLSRRRRIMDVLEKQPLTIDLLARYLGTSPERVKPGISWLLRNGFAGYIYTGFGKVYYSTGNPRLLYKDYGNYLSPDYSTEATVVPYSVSGTRLRAVKGSYNSILNRLRSLLDRETGLSRLRFSVLVNCGSIVRLVNLDYRFLMETEDVLFITVKNAFTAHNIQSCEPSLTGEHDA